MLYYKVDSIENLMGAGKGEHCPYVCALINKVCSFALGIKVHITSLVELMSKMSAFDNPGEVTAIELQGSWYFTSPVIPHMNRHLVLDFSGLISVENRRLFSAAYWSHTPCLSWRES